MEPTIELEPNAASPQPGVSPQPERCAALGRGPSHPSPTGAQLETTHRVSPKDSHYSVRQVESLIYVGLPQFRPDQNLVQVFCQQDDRVPTRERDFLGVR